MEKSSHAFEAGWAMLKERQYGEVAKRLARQVHQRWTALGLKRDLAIDFAGPRAGIQIAVRPYRDGDFDALFPDPTLLPRSERLELAARRSLLRADIPTCYVAVDVATERPCYMQWLIAAEHNNRVQSFFKGRFPVLAHDEALLENAYTPPEYRGKGIMPAAMSMIAERAREFGARYVVTFVLEDNIPSLKGCRKAGFAPYLVRTDRHLLFHTVRTRRFEPFIPATASSSHTSLFSQSSVGA